jgi:hypothetical protein
MQLGIVNLAKLGAEFTPHQWVALVAGRDHRPA